MSCKLAMSNEQCGNSLCLHCNVKCHFGISNYEYKNPPASVGGFYFGTLQSLLANYTDVYTTVALSGFAVGIITEHTAADFCIAIRFYFYFFRRNTILNKI